MYFGKNRNALILKMKTAGLSKQEKLAAVCLNLCHPDG